MFLGWESNMSIGQESAKLEVGKLSLGVGNPMFPSLGMKHCLSLGLVVEDIIIPSEASVPHSTSLRYYLALQLP